MLKNLRYLIILSVALYLLQEIFHYLYSPAIDSNLLMQYRNYVMELAKSNSFFAVLMLVVLILNAYAFSALWYGYNSGRWSYVLAIVLAITGDYLLRVVAFSSIEFIMLVLGLLVTGMILTLIFTQPLQDEFAREKPRKVWPMISLFFLFLFLFFIPGIIIAFTNPGYLQQ